MEKNTNFCKEESVMIILLIVLYMLQNLMPGI
nr:MAG TPA: hypothetical protein [Caudoviricetes sp.]